MVEEYDDPNGKFGNTLGNVALIDCKYVGELIPVKQLSEQLKRSMARSNSTEDGFSLPEIDFCNYAMSVYGVLEDQPGTYMGTKSRM